MRGIVELDALAFSANGYMHDIDLFGLEVVQQRIHHSQAFHRWLIRNFKIAIHGLFVPLIANI